MHFTFTNVLSFGKEYLLVYFHWIVIIKKNYHSCIAGIFIMIYFFNPNLNRGCLVYMFSLGFSGSKVLINLRQPFRIPKIFS